MSDERCRVDLWEAVKNHLEPVSVETGLSISQIVNIVLINHYRILGYLSE